jgi:hypothetical protein
MKKLRTVSALTALLLAVMLSASCVLVPPGFGESTREHPFRELYAPAYTPRASATDTAYAAFDKLVTLPGWVGTEHTVTVNADVPGMYTVFLTVTPPTVDEHVWIYNAAVGEDAVSQTLIRMADHFKPECNSLSVYLDIGENTLTVKSTSPITLNAIELRLAYAGKMISTVGFGGLGQVVSPTDTKEGVAYTKETALAEGKNFVTTEGGEGDYRNGSGCTVFMRNGDAYLTGKIKITADGVYRLGLFANNFYDTDNCGNVMLRSASGRTVTVTFNKDNKAAAVEAGLYSGVDGFGAAFWMNGDFVYLKAGEYTVEYKASGSFIMGAVTVLSSNNNSYVFGNEA